MMIHGRLSQRWSYTICTKVQRLLLLRAYTLHSPSRRSHLAPLQGEQLEIPTNEQNQKAKAINAESTGNNFDHVFSHDNPSSVDRNWIWCMVDSSLALLETWICIGRNKIISWASNNHGNTVLPPASSLPHGQILPIWQLLKENSTHAIQIGASIESICAINSMLASIVNHVTNHHATLHATLLAHLQHQKMRQISTKNPNSCGP